MVSGSSRDPERYAQSSGVIPGGDAPSAPGRSLEPLEPLEAAPIKTAQHGPSPSRRRVWAARLLALAADAVQFALLPLVIGGAISPVDDAIDIVTGLALTALLGFHWAYLPSFIAKLVPFVDMVPSWTLAVAVSTRGKGGRD